MPTMVAQMTGLRGIGRLNEHQRHACGLRLVGHKLPQLEEAPAGVAVSLWLANPRPLPDARQIFQGNLTPCGLRLLDKLFTDRMVDRSHMALLASRQPFQKSFGFFRAFGLERTPDLGIVGTHAVHFGGFVGLCIGIDRHTPSAKINAERARWCLRERGQAFELDVQEERPITSLDQRGTRGRVALEPAFLIVAKHRLKALSTVQERQRERPVPFPKAEDTLIIVDGGRSKGRMGLAFDLQCRTHPSDSAYGQIRRQPKPRPDIDVARMLERHLVRGVLQPCHVRNEVAGVGKSLKRCVDLSALLWGGRQFTGQCAYGLHKESVSPMYVTYKTAAKACESVSSSGDESPTLPRAKAHCL